MRRGEALIKKETPKPRRRRAAMSMPVEVAAPWRMVPTKEMTAPRRIAIRRPNLKEREREGGQSQIRCDFNVIELCRNPKPLLTSQQRWGRRARRRRNPTADQRR